MKTDREFIDYHLSTVNAGMGAKQDFLYGVLLAVLEGESLEDAVVQVKRKVLGALLVEAARGNS